MVQRYFSVGYVLRLEISNHITRCSAKRTIDPCDNLRTMFQKHTHVFSHEETINNTYVGTYIINVLTYLL